MLYNVLYIYFWLTQMGWWEKKLQRLFHKMKIMQHCKTCYTPTNQPLIFILYFCLRVMTSHFGTEETKKCKNKKNMALTITIEPIATRCSIKKIHKTSPCNCFCRNIPLHNLNSDPHLPKKCFYFVQRKSCKNDEN